MADQQDYFMLENFTDRVFPYTVLRVFRQLSLFNKIGQWAEHIRLSQAFFHPEIKLNFHA
jgi:hypothetical protein